MSDRSASQQPSSFTPTEFTRGDRIIIQDTQSDDHCSQNNNLASSSLEDMRQLSNIYKGLQATGANGLSKAIIDLDTGIEFGVGSIEKDLNAAASTNGSAKDTSQRMRTGAEQIQDMLDSVRMNPDTAQRDEEGARRWQQLHIPPPLGLPPLPRRSQQQ